MLFLPYPPKRDSLLCVARHKAVTRTWDAPLSKALRPGFSVSGVEPSGVCFSWYCQPSSRSLGHSLLLGQRSRLNFLSDLVRSLFHQHHRRPHTEFVSHRHNSDPRTEMSWMFFSHAAKEFSQFAVLADRRPRSLDKLLRNRPSPVWVIEPRSVFSPVEFSVGTRPRKAGSWRMFLIWRQSPTRARSLLATIQPIPGSVFRYSIH